jgi:transcriptional antiterminator RfaH
VEAWHVLYTKPNSEVKLHTALVARGFTAYLPLLPPRQDGYIEPLFPAYLFVRCDLETLGISALKWTPGLRRVVAFEGCPAVMPDEAIALIQAKMRQIEEHGGLPSHLFQPGDQVVIDKGPLAGLRGIFQGPTGPAERVQILIRFLGRANRADVPAGDLRPLSEFEDQQPNRRRRGTRGHGRRVRYRDEGGSGGAEEPGS